MSIFDTETPQQITRDDLLRDDWSPDRLGRTWTKRLKVINPDTNFIAYLYFRYTIRNPQNGKRYELELINSTLIDTTIYKNIRTLQDIHLIIHSIAGKICTTYKIEGPHLVLNHTYETWDEYSKNVIKSKLDVRYRYL